jgi:hypothetical protein
MKPNREILDAAIPSILSAPKDGAIIEQLCFRPDFGTRTYVDEIGATAADGIDGCRWSHTPWLKNEDGTGNPHIQVSILQKRILDLVYAPNTDDLHPGDTMIVDMDLSEENLPIGTILQAGTAQLRVGSHWNNACVKWKVRYGADALDWVREEGNIKHRLRGVLCEVVTDGVISNGATLTKV